MRSFSGIRAGHNSNYGFWPQKFPINRVRQGTNHQARQLTRKTDGAVRSGDHGVRPK
jgi:hypothetical protein